MIGEGDIKFPKTFGREFSGVIVEKGLGTGDRLSIGCSVWGIVPFNYQGCHSQYVLVPQSCTTRRPRHFNGIQCAATLYSGLTAWSGLFISGNLGRFSCKPKRVLVLGASGSVGSSALQILKAENCFVVASCATDAIPLVQKYEPHRIIDYTDPADEHQFEDNDPYDIILDCCGMGPDYARKYNWKFSQYVTFSSPLLKNIDSKGIIRGGAKSASELLKQNIACGMPKNGRVKWAYFIPSIRGIKYLRSLVNCGKLTPLIDSVYNFENMPSAYNKVRAGHLRGKVVVDMSVRHNDCDY